MAKEQDLVYKDNGEVKALVAADITFYLTQFSGAQPGFVRAYEIALEHLAPHVTWYRTEAMTRSKKFTSDVLKMLPTWFQGKSTEREEYGLTFTSGRTADDVGPWGFEFSVEPHFRQTSSGYFQMNLPAEILQSEPDRFAKLVKSLAEALHFRSGHAGYGIQYDEGDILDDRDAQQRAWCNRYEGLDCRDLAVITDYARDAIKGVNWLTLLDYDFCHKLGGVEALRKKLSPPVSIDELKHGIILRAGPIPLLGDRNRKDDMSAYRSVARTLKRLRIRKDFSLPVFDDDEDETEKWMARFEDK